MHKYDEQNLRLSRYIKTPGGSQDKMIVALEAIYERLGEILKDLDAIRANR